MSHPILPQKSDAASRTDRAAALRRSLLSADGLHIEAKRLLSHVPDEAEALIAFSPEGWVVAGAASAMARHQGRSLAAWCASLFTPLAPRPVETGQAWLNVEEALGLGTARHWVVAWADANNAGRRLEPLQAPLARLSQVA